MKGSRARSARVGTGVSASAPRASAWRRMGLDSGRKAGAASHRRGRRSGRGQPPGQSGLHSEGKVFGMPQEALQHVLGAARGALACLPLRFLSVAVTACGAHAAPLSFAGAQPGLSASRGQRFTGRGGGRVRTTLAEGHTRPRGVTSAIHRRPAVLPCRTPLPVWTDLQHTRDSPWVVAGSVLVTHGAECWSCEHTRHRHIYTSPAPLLRADASSGPGIRCLLLWNLADTLPVATQRH